MRNRTIAVLGALALASALGGCGDWLSGPNLDTDPNRPSNANITQLYQGVQVNSFVWFTGDLARVASMWNQEMAGTGRQQQTRDLYDVTEGDFDTDFSRIYTGGGLIDMRRGEAAAEAAGDRTYGGIFKIWEAMKLGMAASLWGAIPYSEAVSDSLKPHLDTQPQVYAAVQALLDQAIADLQAGAGAGPGSLDLVYGGDRQSWIRAAYTLKARFYMHWVEAQSAGGTADSDYLSAGVTAGAAANQACGGNCLTSAMAAAANGISASSGDLRTFHADAPGQQNLWYQFINIARQGDIGAGKRLVDIMNATADPRRGDYFSTVEGAYVGAPPGTEAAVSLLSPTGRGRPDYRQPLVTWAENQLILAEGNYRLGATATARDFLNNVRLAAGLPASASSGAALLNEIATEKYISLFQNIEVWNDHKRLCLPVLAPAAGSELPGRLYYGEDERNVNPNVPSPDEASIYDRNANDPLRCVVPVAD
jgi:starch-binding outer membrane protein, SusD/RagB family